MADFCAYCSPQEHTAQRCYDYFERRLIQCALDGDWGDITHIGIELRARKRLLDEEAARAVDRANGLPACGLPMDGQYGLCGTKHGRHESIADCEAAAANAAQTRQWLERQRADDLKRQLAARMERIAGDSLFVWHAGTPEPRTQEINDHWSTDGEAALTLAYAVRAAGGLDKWHSSGMAVRAVADAVKRSSRSWRAWDAEQQADQAEQDRLYEAQEAAVDAEVKP